jgi:hypothetical protein
VTGHPTNRSNKTYTDRPSPSENRFLHPLQPFIYRSLGAGRSPIMADLIDPTTKGNYPVILGVGLLGKPSNEIFTGIRCKSPSPPLHSSASHPWACDPGQQTSKTTELLTHRLFTPSR